MTTINIRGKKIKLKSGARPIAEIRKEVTEDTFYREIALLGKTLEEMSALVKLNEANPKYNKKLLADEKQYLKELKITRDRKWVHTTFCNQTEEPQIQLHSPTDKFPDEGAFQHTPDYRSVILRGQSFTLTTQQARVIELLHKAYNNGTPDLGSAYILEKIESTSNRLRDIFQKKGGKTYRTLIKSGERKGTVRLNLD